MFLSSNSGMQCFVSSSRDCLMLWIVSALTVSHLQCLITSMARLLRVIVAISYIANSSLQAVDEDTSWLLDGESTRWNSMKYWSHWIQYKGRLVTRQLARRPALESNTNDESKETIGTNGLQMAYKFINCRSLGLWFECQHVKQHTRLHLSLNSLGNRSLPALLHQTRAATAVVSGMATEAIRMGLKLWMLKVNGFNIRFRWMKMNWRSGRTSFGFGFADVPWYPHLLAFIQFDLQRGHLDADSGNCPIRPV